MIELGRRFGGWVGGVREVQGKSRRAEITIGETNFLKGKEPTSVGERYGEYELRTGDRETG